jgi:D-glycero-alpha-D-manno-heptose-7-phosphate kinase
MARTETRRRPGAKKATARKGSGSRKPGESLSRKGSEGRSSDAILYRARAPLRISFCGGGTDVDPYPAERGGVVLSTTIDKFAYATLRPRADGRLTIHSLDYDVVADYRMGKKKLAYDGELDIVKAVANHFAAFRKGPPHGFDLFIHSDAPPGSGLGSSSTMTVALVGVMKEWLRTPLTDYEIAELTYQIERVELKLAGGRQDQYAATFGGFNYIEFQDSTTVVNPLRIKPATVRELEYNLILCFTGRTRESAGIVADQTEAYRKKEKNVVQALDRMKELTIAMKSCLLRDRLNEFGNLLDVAWQEKTRLSERITNPRIDELYAEARRSGALGGKILGAGGGGYLLLYCPFDRKHTVAEKLEKFGGQVVPFSFREDGLTTWSVSEGQE